MMRPALQAPLMIQSDTKLTQVKNNPIISQMKSMVYSTIDNTIVAIIYLAKDIYGSGV